MTIDIQPIDPVNRDFFAGEVSGLDLTRPLSKQEVAAVHAGMDRFGVLVFHDQKIDDDQQLVFSRGLGPLEQATGDIAAPEDRRVSMDLNDISNLDKNNKVLARDDRRRLFGLGNQLWHSDSSFKPVPAKYSLLSARQIPPTGGNTEFADMRAAYDALDEKTKKEVHDLICQHSQIFSRGILGFTDQPNVSIDFNHDPRSSVFHMDQTKVMDGTLVRVMSWYDNEWGFSNRMVDTAVAMGKLG